MKITAKQMCITAVLLAICILSQYFKNFSVYITGPVVNTCIILTTLFGGFALGIIISIIAPITAFLFTGSPIMAGIPLMFPAVMAGNCILVICTWFFNKKFKYPLHTESGLIIGIIIKSLFMGIVISLILLPMFSSNIILPNGKVMPDIKVRAAQYTFSVVQLITGAIGCLYAIILRIPLHKVMKNQDQ